jgi:hypothetical protein
MPRLNALRWSLPAALALALGHPARAGVSFDVTGLVQAGDVSGFILTGFDQFGAPVGYFGSYGRRGDHLRYAVSYDPASAQVVDDTDPNSVEYLVSGLLTVTNVTRYTGLAPAFESFFDRFFIRVTDSAAGAGADSFTVDDFAGVIGYQDPRSVRPDGAAGLTLIDPTGTAWSSAAVPGALDPGRFPLGGFFMTSDDGGSLSGTLSAAPEPSSLALAGLGAVGLIGAGMRRRRA